MTMEEVIEEYCKISALAYKSISDFNDPEDGFCMKCPVPREMMNYAMNNPDATEEDLDQMEKLYFKHTGNIIKYIRQAVVEKLKRDGYDIAPGFSPDTGEEIKPEPANDEQWYKVVKPIDDDDDDDN